MSNISQNTLGNTEQLQSDLKRVLQECDHALEEMTKWRRRYEVEAKQRRSEAETAEQTIRELRAELLQLCQLGPSVRSAPALTAEKAPELAQLREERDRLTEALAREQQQHAKTRANLITALGEALQRSKA
jgi:predicted  nucleic acid-binding Zn-ribbon protein